MSKVKVNVRSSYGTQYFYPDCDLTRLLTNIRRSKTLSLSILKSVAVIGYEIEYTGEKIQELDDIGAKYIG